MTSVKLIIAGQLFYTKRRTSNDHKIHYRLRSARSVQSKKRKEMEVREGVTDFREVDNEVRKEKCY